MCGVISGGPSLQRGVSSDAFPNRQEDPAPAPPSSPDLANLSSNVDSNTIDGLLSNLTISTEREPVAHLPFSPASGQGMNAYPSPSMANQLPPPSMNEINGELMRIPNTLLPRIKQELMIPQDKDFAALTTDEKVCPHVFRPVYLLIALSSIAFLCSTAKGIVISPSRCIRRLLRLVP